LKRIHFRHRQAQRHIPVDLYPINEKIRATEVRVIDENGQMLGVMPTFQAISLAKERGLDLIAVSPKAQPPVAKFISYGSFKYQQEKALKKQKAQQKKIEIKEMRISPRIGKHDLEIRVNQARKFIERGDKLSMVVILKGRERQHPELGKEIIENFINSLSQLITIEIEQPIKRQGNNFSAVIAGKKLD
jgi:translation initiation factor IF-3